MSPVLIKLILVAKEERYLLCLLEGKLEVYEVVQKLRQAVEYNVLCQWLSYSHSFLLLLFACG
jgi:hypothetical protein